MSLTAVSSDASIVPNPTITGVGATRTLSFSPVADANGTVTITVTAEDDGGTENGGDDIFRWPFTITVTEKPPPVVETPIADLPADEDSLSLPDHANLNTVFEDGDNLDSELVYTITMNSPAGIVTATIDTDDTLDLSFAADAFGAANITVRATDPDKQFAEDTFTVTVTPVNDVPRFDPIDNQEVLEDSGMADVPITGISPGPANEANQTVSLTAVSSDASIVPNPTVAVAGATRTLSFTPVADATGEVTITVTAQDDGGTENGGVDTFQLSFTITVTPVNDAPRFDLIDNQEVREDSALTIVTITGISPGPANEASQTVSLTAVSSDASIVPNPTIAGTGVNRSLSFTPVADANGEVTIMVTTQDDGGTEKGGVDTLQQSFTITVTPVNDAPRFDLIDNRVVLEDSGQTIVAVTGISPGPANEANQTVSLTAVSSDASIVPNPTTVGAGANRTLNFIPVADANGEVTITVTAQDDGGTENGGVGTFQRSFSLTVTPANDAPRFDLIDNQGVREDSGTMTVTITGISPGPANEANQTVRLTTVSSDASILPNPTITGVGATRTLSFTPVADATGEVTITVTAQDDGGTENGGVDTFPRTFTITVTPVNDAPRFDLIDNRAVLENSGQTIVAVTGISSGPADEASQTVKLTAVSSDASVVPNPTTVGVGANRTLNFIPVADANGEVTITVTAQDDGGTENGGVDIFQQSFTLTVTPVNDAPRFDLIADQTVDEDSGRTPVSITRVSPGPANESNQTVTLTAVSSDETIVPNPTITGTGVTRTLSFTPVTVATGEVTITVTAQDDGGTENGGVDTFPRTFTITVTPVNDAPRFDLIDNRAVLENSGQTIVAVTGISSGPADEASQTVKLTAVSSDASIVPNPTTVGVGANRTLNFIPVADANGEVTITVTAQDDGGTENGGVDTFQWLFTITVTEKPPPVVETPIAARPVDEDSPPVLNHANLTTVFEDADNPDSELVYTITTNVPAGIVAAIIEADNTLGLSFVADAFGIANITVRATDPDKQFAEDTFTVTVTPVNDVPRFDPIDNQEVRENSGQTIVAVTGISPGPANEASQTVSLTAVSSDASIVPNPTTVGVGANRTLNFIPAADATGEVTITVTTQDDGGTEKGGVDTLQQSFTITVTPVNDAPRFDLIDNQEVREDSALTIVTITGISPEPANEASQTVNLTAISGDAGILPNPMIAGAGVNRSLSFTPVADANGIVTITVIAQDDGGTENGGVDTFPRTFTITVTPVNDAPRFDLIDNRAVLENSGQTIVAVTGISPGPANEANQTVSLTAVSSDASIVPNPTTVGAGANRTLNFIPVADANGEVTITVTAQDDGGTENGGVDTFQRSFSLTVTPANDAPRFDLIDNQGVREDSGTMTVTITGISPGPANEANQTVRLTTVSSDASILPNPTITGVGATRTLSFTPVADATGEVTITLTAQDDGGTENGGVDTFPRTFTITVTPVNDAPRFDLIDNRAVLENSGQTIVAVTGISSGPADEASQTVKLTAVSSDASIVPNPTTVGVGANRTLNFIPVADANGEVTITVTAQDDGGTANGGVDAFQQPFTITVRPFNEGPTITSTAPTTATEDIEYRYTLAVTDPDDPNDGSGALRFSLSNPPAGMAVSATGVITWTPVEGVATSGLVTVTVADGGEDGAVPATEAFTITVTPVNDNRPVGNDDSTTVAEGGTVTTLGGDAASLLSNDTDLDLPNDTLTVNTRPVSGPSHGTLTLNADGTFSYTHDDSENFSDRFTYRVRDAAGETATAKVEITITPVNDNPPVPVNRINDAPKKIENSPPVLDHADLNDVFEDVDNPDSDLRYTIEVNTREDLVAAIIDTNDTLDLSFVADAFGEANITIRATDPGGLFGEDTFTVTVGLGVRPGDADNNGGVNILDILPLGDHWGESGPPRNPVLELFTEVQEWKAFFAEPWTSKDATYADTNGDGQVDQDDIIPIAIYWNRTGNAMAPQMDQSELVIDQLEQLHI